MLKFIPAILWAAVIALLCLLPQSAFYSPSFLHKLPADKIVHFGMFFILAFLAFRPLALRSQLGFRKTDYRLLLLILLLVFYGGFTELAQGWFTKTRHTELSDFIADCVGILAGFVACMLFYRKKMVNRQEYIRY